MHLPHALLYLNFTFSCYFIISLVLAPCISHRRYMLISLWLLCAASPCHLMHTLLQERYSSVAPQGSLPAFEIAFQTFCLGLWQDTSLLLTAITALVQPAGTPLNEAKSLGDIQRFFFFIEKPLSFRRESSLSDIVARAGLRGAEGGGGRVAEQPWVSQVDLQFLSWPAMLRSIVPFWILPPSHLSRRIVYMWVSLYLYFTDIYEFTTQSVASQLLLKAGCKWALMDTVLFRTSVHITTNWTLTDADFQQGQKKK